MSLTFNLHHGYHIWFELSSSFLKQSYCTASENLYNAQVIWTTFICIFFFFWAWQTVYIILYYIYIYCWCMKKLNEILSWPIDEEKINSIEVWNKLRVRKYWDFAFFRFTILFTHYFFKNSFRRRVYNASLPF